MDSTHQEHSSGNNRNDYSKKTLKSNFISNFTDVVNEEVSSGTIKL